MNRKSLLDQALDVAAALGRAIEPVIPPPRRITAWRPGSPDEPIEQIVQRWSTMQLPETTQGIHLVRQPFHRHVRVAENDPENGFLRGSTGSDVVDDSTTAVYPPVARFQRQLRLSKSGQTDRGADAALMAVDRPQDAGTVGGE